MNVCPSNSWAKGIVLALFFIAQPVVGDDLYEFELVLFERPGGGSDEFWPPSTEPPDRAVARGGSIKDLPGAPRSMGPIAYTLRQKGAVVLEHLAWRQSPAERNSSVWYSLNGSRVNGLIRVTRGRFLHLESDLMLRDGISGEPYRVKHYRRMRSGELNYIDHPKLGMIIKAERYQPAEPADVDEESANGEPKPATPPTSSQPSG